MRGFDAQLRLGVEGMLRYEAPCRIPGELWDLGAYPGLVEGAGAAAGELHAILDEDVLTVLDAFEGVEYVRRKVTLLDPPVEAWVYVFVGGLAGRRPVPSGCWRTHALKAGGSR